MAVLAHEQAATVIKLIERFLDSATPEPRRLDLLWKHMFNLEATVLAAQLRNTIGDDVYSGPFKGMRLTPQILTDSYAPILLGCYEQELHPAIEAMIVKPFRTLLNIGCGYGYYSVGMARRMAQLDVQGFDTNPDEQNKCKGLADLNHVTDRVTVHGQFDGEGFAAYADRRTLVIMDIEGAEEQLLDPVAYPALASMDIIVELHDVLKPGLSEAITRRFTATHEIETIRNEASLFNLRQLVPASTFIDPMHHYMATWERRDGPTPWAVMTARTYPT